MNRRQRCLDLGNSVAPSYAAKLLADVGWDVVKLEPPDGDPLRHASSRWGGGQGGAFAFVNQGKRSVVINDRTMLEALVNAAEVVIGDFSSAGRSSLDLMSEDFVNLAPKLVLTSVSAFGLVGPKAGWAATELTVQAASGFLFLTGEWDQPPMQLPPYASAILGGLAGASATLAALRLSRRDGLVRRPDVSQMEALANHNYNFLARYARSGEVMRREQRTKFAVRMAPTSDGFVYCSPGGGSVSNMMGMAKLLNDPRLEEERFQTAEGRMQNWQEFTSIVVPPFAEKTAQEWFESAEALDMTFALVQTIDDLFGCPQLNARGFFHLVSGTAGGMVPLPGRPFRLENGPDASDLMPPATGQHTSEVMEEWLS